MGELAALLSALLWALSSAMMGSQAARVPAPVISAIRLLGATLVIWAAGAALLLAGAIEGVSAVRALALAGTGVLGPGVGDTLYIGSIPAVGLARAFPISMAAFPLFTVLLAALLVGESITLPVVIGAALIVVGTYLIGVRRAETAVDQEPSDLAARHPTPAWVSPWSWRRPCSGHVPASGCASPRPACRRCWSALSVSRRRDC